MKVGTVELQARISLGQFKNDLQKLEQLVQKKPDMIIKAKLDTSELKDTALPPLNSDYANVDKLANKEAIKIKVDDSRLTELNEHFKLKEKHYDELQNKFNQEPLTPNFQKGVNSINSEQSKTTTVSPNQLQPLANNTNITDNNTSILTDIRNLSAEILDAIKQLNVTASSTNGTFTSQLLPTVRSMGSSFSSMSSTMNSFSGIMTKMLKYQQLTAGHTKWVTLFPMMILAPIMGFGQYLGGLVAKGFQQAQAEKGGRNLEELGYIAGQAFGILEKTVLDSSVRILGIGKDFEDTLLKTEASLQNFANGIDTLVNFQGFRELEKAIGTLGKGIINFNKNIINAGLLKIQIAKNTLKENRFDDFRQKRKQKVQEAADLIQQKKSDIDIEPEKKEKPIIIGIGGLAGGNVKGEKPAGTSSFSPTEVLKQAFQDKVEVIGVESRATDIVGDIHPSKAPITAAIRGLINTTKATSPDIVSDAINMAMKAIEIKLQDPEANISLMGYSAGGLPTVQATEILQALSKRDEFAGLNLDKITGMAMGSPVANDITTPPEFFSSMGATDIVRVLEQLTGTIHGGMFQEPSGREISNVGKHSLESYIADPRVAKKLEEVTGEKVNIANFNPEHLVYKKVETVGDKISKELYELATNFVDQFPSIPVKEKDRFQEYKEAKDTSDDLSEGFSPEEIEKFEGYEKQEKEANKTKIPTLLKGLQIVKNELITGLENFFRDKPKEDLNMDVDWGIIYNSLADIVGYLDAIDFDPQVYQEQMVEDPIGTLVGILEQAEVVATDPTGIQSVLDILTSGTNLAKKTIFKIGEQLIGLITMLGTKATAKILKERKKEKIDRGAIPRVRETAEKLKQEEEIRKQTNKKNTNKTFTKFGEQIQEAFEKKQMGRVMAHIRRMSDVSALEQVEKLKEENIDFDELTITTGTYNPDPKSGIVNMVDDVVQGENLAQVLVENPRTAETISKQPRLAPILPILQGYDEDAIMLAAEAFTVLQQGIKVHLKSFSGGAVALRDALLILNEMGFEKMVRGTSTGFPATAIDEIPPNLKLYNSEQDPLTGLKAMVERFPIPGLSEKQNKKLFTETGILANQNYRGKVAGVKTHNSQEYSSVSSPDIGNKSLKKMKEQYELFAQFLMPEQKEAMLKTVKDIDKSINIDYAESIQEASAQKQRLESASSITMAPEEKSELLQKTIHKLIVAIDKARDEKDFEWISRGLDTFDDLYKQFEDSLKRIQLQEFKENESQTPEFQESQMQAEEDNAKTTLELLKEVVENIRSGKEAIPKVAERKDQSNLEKSFDDFFKKIGFKKLLQKTVQIQRGEEENLYKKFPIDVITNEAVKNLYSLAEDTDKPQTDKIQEFDELEEQSLEQLKSIKKSIDEDYSEVKEAHQTVLKEYLKMIRALRFLVKENNFSKEVIKDGQKITEPLYRTDINPTPPISDTKLEPYQTDLEIPSISITAEDIKTQRDLNQQEKQTKKERKTQKKQDKITLINNMHSILLDLKTTVESIKDILTDIKSLLANTSTSTSIPEVRLDDNGEVVDPWLNPPELGDIQSDNLESDELTNINFDFDQLINIFDDFIENLDLVLLQHRNKTKEILREQKRILQNNNRILTRILNQGINTDFDLSIPLTLDTERLNTLFNEFISDLENSLVDFTVLLEDTLNNVKIDDIGVNFDENIISNAINNNSVKIDSDDLIELIIEFQQIINDLSVTLSAIDLTIQDESIKQSLDQSLSELNKISKFSNLKKILNKFIDKLNNSITNIEIPNISIDEEKLTQITDSLNISIDEEKLNTLESIPELLSSVDLFGDINTIFDKFINDLTTLFQNNNSLSKRLFNSYLVKFRKILLDRDFNINDNGLSTQLNQFVNNLSGIINSLNNVNLEINTNELDLNLKNTESLKDFVNNFNDNINSLGEITRSFTTDLSQINLNVDTTVFDDFKNALQNNITQLKETIDSFNSSLSGLNLIIDDIAIRETLAQFIKLLRKSFRQTIIKTDIEPEDLKFDFDFTKDIDSLEASFSAFVQMLSAELGLFIGDLTKSLNDNPIDIPDNLGEALNDFNMLNTKWLEGLGILFKKFTEDWVALLRKSFTALKAIYNDFYNDFKVRIINKLEDTIKIFNELDQVLDLEGVFNVLTNILSQNLSKLDSLFTQRFNKFRINLVKDLQVVFNDLVANLASLFNNFSSGDFSNFKTTDFSDSNKEDSPSDINFEIISTYEKGLSDSLSRISNSFKTFEKTNPSLFIDKILKAFIKNESGLKKFLDIFNKDFGRRDKIKTRGRGLEKKIDSFSSKIQTPEHIEKFLNMINNPADFFGEDTDFDFQAIENKDEFKAYDDKTIDAVGNIKKVFQDFDDLIKKAFNRGSIDERLDTIIKLIKKYSVIVGKLQEAPAKTPSQVSKLETSKIALLINSIRQNPDVELTEKMTELFPDIDMTDFENLLNELQIREEKDVYVTDVEILKKVLLQIQKQLKEKKEVVTVTPQVISPVDKTKEYISTIESLFGQKIKSDNLASVLDDILLATGVKKIGKDLDVDFSSKNKSGQIDELIDKIDTKDLLKAVLRLEKEFRKQKYKEVTVPEKYQKEKLQENEFEQLKEYLRSILQDSNIETLDQSAFEKVISAFSSFEGGDFNQSKISLDTLTTTIEYLVKTLLKIEKLLKISQGSESQSLGGYKTQIQNNLQKIFEQIQESTDLDFQDVAENINLTKETSFPDVTDVDDSDTFFQELKKYFSESSEDLGSGLNEGMEGVGEIGKETAEDLNEGFTDEQEIQSPSRVWQRFGEMMGEGLQNGLQSLFDNIKNILIPQLNEDVEEEIEIPEIEIPNSDDLADIEIPDTDVPNSDDLADIEFSDTDNIFSSIRGHFDDLIERFPALQRGLSILQDGFRGIVSLVLLNKIGDILKDFIPVTIELANNLQTIKDKLDFVTQGQGTKVFLELQQFSTQMGLSFETALKGASDFITGTVGTEIEDQTLNMSKDLMKGMAVFGLTTEAQEGVFTAISQIASKGKLSAEEIRGQMGERMPGSFAIGARSMGLSLRQFDKLMSSGNIQAEDFLPKFTKQLVTETKSGLSTGTKSFAAELNRLDSNIYNIQTTIGTNLLEPLKKPLIFVNKILNFISRNMNIIYDVVVALGVVLSTVLVSSVVLIARRFRGGALIRVLRTMGTLLKQNILLYNDFFKKDIFTGVTTSSFFPSGQAIAQNLNNIKNQISTVFRDLTTSSHLSLLPSRQQIAQRLSNIRDKISTVFSDLKTSASQRLSLLPSRQQIEQNLSNIRDKISTVFKDLKTSASQSLTLLPSQQQIAQSLKDIRTQILYVYRDLASLGTQNVSHLSFLPSRQDISTKLNNFKNAFSTLITDLSTRFNNLTAGLQSGMANLFLPIQTKATNLFTTFSTLITDLSTSVNNFFTTITTKAISLFTTIKAGTISLVTTIQTKAISLFTTITTGTMSLFTTIQTKAISLFTTIQTKAIDIAILLAPIATAVLAILAVVISLKTTYRVTFGAGNKILKEQRKVISDLVNSMKELEDQMIDTRKWYHKLPFLTGRERSVHRVDFMTNIDAINDSLQRTTDLLIAIKTTPESIEIEGMNIGLGLGDEDLDKIKNKLDELRLEINDKALELALKSDEPAEVTQPLKDEIAKLREREAALLTEPRVFTNKLVFNSEALEAKISATKKEIEYMNSSLSYYQNTPDERADRLAQIRIMENKLIELTQERDKLLAIEKNINKHIEDQNDLYAKQIRMLTKFNIQFANINWISEGGLDKQIDLVIQKIQKKITQTDFDIKNQQINIEYQIEKIGSLENIFGDLEKDLNEKSEILGENLQKSLAKALGVDDIQKAVAEGTLSPEAIQQFQNNPIEEIKELLDNSSNNVRSFLDVLERVVDVDRTIKQEQLDLVNAFDDQREAFKSQKDELLGFIRSIKDLQISVDDYYRQRDRQLEDFEIQYENTLRENKKNVRNLIEQYDDLKNQLNNDIIQQANEIENTRKKIKETKSFNQLRKKLSFGAEGIFSGIIDIVENIGNANLSYEEQMMSITEERLQIESDTTNTSRQIRDMAEAIFDNENQRLQSLRELIRSQEDFILNQEQSWKGIEEQVKDMEIQAKSMGLSFNSIAQLLSDATSEFDRILLKLKNYNPNFNSIAQNNSGSNIKVPDQGITIGRIGGELEGDAVGSSKGNHLHITIRNEEGTAINPLDHNIGREILKVIQMGKYFLPDRSISSPFGVSRGDRTHKGVDYGAGQDRPYLKVHSDIQSIQFLEGDDDGYGNWIKMVLADFPDFTIELGHLANETKNIVANLKQQSIELNNPDYRGQAAKMLRKLEGFRENAYLDVDKYRVGYGTEYFKDEPNSYRKGSFVLKDRAEEQLTEYDIPRFEKRIIEQITSELWESLNDNIKASLISVAYNKGSLPPNIIHAVQTRDPKQIADSIRNTDRRTHKNRRDVEADNVMKGINPRSSSPSVISSPKITPNYRKTELRQIPLNVESLNSDTSLKPIVNENTSDVKQLIKMLSQNQEISQTQIETVLRFNAIGDVESAMKLLESYTDKIEEYRKRLLDNKAEQAHQDLIKEELNIQRQLNQKRLELDETLRNSRNTLLSNQIQLIKNQSEVKGYTSYLDTMKTTVIDAVKSHIDYISTLETEIRNIEKLIDANELTRDDLQKVIDLKYEDNLISEETYQATKKLIEQGADLQIILEKLKIEYQDMVEDTEKMTSAIVKNRIELAKLEAQITRLSNISSIYSSMRDIAKTAKSMNLSKALNFKILRLEGMNKYYSLMRDINKELAIMEQLKLESPEDFSESLYNELKMMQDEFKILIPVSIEQSIFDAQLEEVMNNINSLKDMFNSIGEVKNKIDFGSGDTEIFLGKIIEIKSKYMNLDKTLKTLEASTTDAFNLQIIQDYRDSLGLLQSQELQYLKYEMSDVHRFLREPFKTAISGILNDFVKGTTSINDLITSFLQNIAGKIIDFYIESNIDKFLMTIFDLFGSGSYGEATIDQGLGITEKIIGDSQIYDNRVIMDVTGYQIENQNLELMLRQVFGDFITDYASVNNQHVSNLKTANSSITPNLSSNAEGSFNMNMLSPVISQFLPSGFGSAFNFIGNILGFKDGGMVGDRIDNFKDGGMISDRIDNFKDGGMISDRIDNFKDGGMIGDRIDNFKDGGMIRNYRKGDKIKAMGLGLGVMEAMKREGTNAVPIVANTEERVLNANDTKIFNQLLEQGKWDQIKSENVSNYFEGGLLSNRDINNYRTYNNNTTANKKESSQSKTVVNSPNIWNIYTKDADSFQQSQTQIAYEQNLRQRRQNKYS